MRWLSSLKKSLSPALRAGTIEKKLPDTIRILLSQKRASALRAALKQACETLDGLPFDEMIEQARQAGFEDNEVEKLKAYVEFFTGQSALAYRRVLDGRLAWRDYPLFMTACVYCYLHDRYEEGYALVEQFEPSGTEAFDECEYLAFAGYLAFAAGRGADAAIAYFDRALDQGMLSPLLAVNAYPVYFEAGRHLRVAELRRLIHEHFPEDQEAIYALACGELARDYYPEGFRLAETRYQMPEVGRSINASLLIRPRWRGEPLEGKRLLVHGEQGLGDVAMMSRYLPQLTALGAKVIVDCLEAAIPFLAHNFPECQFVPGDLKKPVRAEFDLWTGLMSLPFHFNTTADSVPSTRGYLRVPPEQAGYWRERIAELSQEGTPRIGLAWSGNPAHRADKRRSIAFERLAPWLRENSGLQFFTLQTAVPAIHPANLIDVSGELVTLADTAALIAEMDLVVTVDTSVVHIAGALGKPTWLLLPYRYEWRWSLEGEKNNWYDSVRVLRQKTHGDWDGLLSQVLGRRLGEFAENLKRKEQGTL